MLLILIGSGCNPDKETKLDVANISLKTNDASVLFFKNVRQYYYDLEENKEAGFNIYRKSDRSSDDQKPVLNLAIVHAWKVDQAYVLLEPNKWLEQRDTWNIEWSVPGGESGKLNYSGGNIQEQLDLVTKLYNLVLSDASFKINNQPFLKDKTEREAFRILPPNRKFINQGIEILLGYNTFEFGFVIFSSNR